MPMMDDPQSVPVFLQKIKAYTQMYLDKVTPYVPQRWAAFGVILFLFVLRVFFYGWYMICYILFIYLLSLFLQFLQPKFDVTLQQELREESMEEGLTEEEKQNQASGTSQVDDDEFRPFIRRLPEFKFWLRGFVATCVALVGSFIPFLDLPVFWPILLMYFIVLFIVTIRKQVQHMIKYHYFPLDIGKAKYNRK